MQGYDEWKTDPGPAYDGPSPMQEKLLDAQERNKELLDLIQDMAGYLDDLGVDDPRALALVERYHEVV